MNKQKKRQIKKEQLLEDEALMLHRSQGNGILRRQIWVDENKKVTRYSLTYVNHRLYAGDNGRVLGYDNAHGYHHKHYMGEVEPVQFNSFTELEQRFQLEFEALHEKAKSKK